MQIQSKTAWLACNNYNPNQATDFFSNTGLVIPQANYFEIRAALFQGDPTNAANMVTDLTNLTSVTLSLYQDNALGTSLGQWTVAAANFHNPNCTYANWAAQTDWQFGFAVTADQDNWTPGSGWDNVIYYEIEVDNGNGPVLVCTGAASYQPTGSTPTNIVNSASYLTATQIAAAYVAVTPQTLTTAQQLQAAQNLGLLPGVNFALQLVAGNPLTTTAVTQETGGTASCLDHIDPTAAFGPLSSLPVGFLVSFQSATGEQTYVVQSGAVTPGPGIVCNANYNSSTQPKYFAQV